MADDPLDNVDLALEELENEPLPTKTRDRTAENAAEDDIEVEYGDEIAPQSDKSVPTERQPREKRPIDADEGIESLRARLQASDIARRQAEERANLAENARAQAGGAVQDANVSFLTSALDGLRQNIEVMQANLTQAYAEQDFAAAARMQTEIARAAQRESQIEAGLEALKTQPRPQPQAPQQVDQVEAVARQLTPNAAAWIRSHPDYITDPSKNANLMSAHYAAMGRGLAGDSPEYIRFVEGHLGLEEAPRGERREMAQDRPRAPPAAPVGRANGGVNNPNVVRLTPDEREMARENFPDEMVKDPSGKLAEKAYARNKLLLVREGRMKLN